MENEPIPETDPGTDRLFIDRLPGFLVLIPCLIYDAVYLVLRPLLTYAAPIAFICIGIYLQFGVFMDMKKDTSQVSNTVTALWVTLSALGYTWASAVEKEDKDFGFIMDISKRFMYASIALILATGFKFALVHSPHDFGLPFFGGLLRIVLVVIMACFFGQSMLEAFLPLLKLHTYLSRGMAYLPGLRLLRRNLPGFMDGFPPWGRAKRAAAAGHASGREEPGTGAHA